MKIAAKSEIGNIRKENEDRYYIDPSGLLIAIADGMGGHENGRIAASLATETFAQYRDDMLKAEFSEQKLAFVLKEINERVYNYKQEQAGGKMMGTTFTAVIVQNGFMRLAHVGDSRVYLYRAGEISQLTQEHSFLAELLRSGQAGSEALLNSEKSRHVLTKAIGPEKEVEGQFASCALKDGDLLVLCTDGLHNAVSDEEIAEYLAKDSSLEDKVEELVALALARGGNDNITLILYQYEQEGA